LSEGGEGPLASDEVVARHHEVIDGENRGELHPGHHGIRDGEASVGLRRDIQSVSEHPSGPRWIDRRAGRYVKEAVEFEGRRHGHPVDHGCCPVAEELSMRHAREIGAA
jgi:hypothetical protein